MKSLLFRSIVGAIAGLLGWLIWEPSAPSDVFSRSWAAWSTGFILTSAVFIGAAIGLVNGLYRGGKLHAFKEAGMGALLGLIGAEIGTSIGGSIAAASFPQLGTGTYPLPVDALGRIVVFTPICIGIGLAIGGSTLSVQRAIQGAIGGLFAGVIAGAVFDPISTVLGNLQLAAEHRNGGEVGGPGRAAMVVIIGFAVALFVGLAEILMRSAWIRLQLGRNEGKEWSIDRPNMTIGRSESADIPVFGDPTIAPAHAQIQQRGGSYVLVDGNSPVGTYLNGQRIQQAPLFHGALIRIGGAQFEFLIKNGRRQQPAVAPQPRPGENYMATGMPAGYPMQAPMANPASPTMGYPSPPVSTPTMMSPMGQPSGGFVMVALDGPLGGQRFPVTGPTDIGREVAGIVLAPDTQVSRRHAQVSPAAGGLTVNDNNSTNGTFVNGQRVTQALMRPGDMLKIGATTFRLESI